jgi:hypothetical protein
MKATRNLSSALVLILLFFLSAPLLAQRRSAGPAITTASQDQPQNATGSVQLGPSQPLPLHKSATFSSAPPRPFGDWRNSPQHEWADSGWCVPDTWISSDTSTDVSRYVKGAAGMPQEVVSAALRVQEHASERVQPAPRIGED